MKLHKTDNVNADAVIDDGLHIRTDDGSLSYRHAASAVDCREFIQATVLCFMTVFSASFSGTPCSC